MNHRLLILSSRGYGLTSLTDIAQTILYTGGLTRSKYVLYHVKKRLQETGLRDIEMVDSGAM